MLLLNIGNSAVLLAGTVLTAMAEDSHGLMRTGAFLAAFTGIFVVWQVREEMEVERNWDTSHADSAPVALTPKERKADQLKSARHERRDTAMRQARLSMVLAIAMWLFLGELLHGFGDVVYHKGKAAFGVPDSMSDQSASVSSNRH